MASVQEMLMTLHMVLLLLFVGATSVLLLVTVANRFRISRILLTWRAGRLRGLPLWPSIFLGIVLLFAGYTLVLEPERQPMVLAGYLLGGGFWFAAMSLAKGMVITDYGVIRNINRTSRTVAWGQIVDYFVDPGRTGSRYVFFYLDGDGTRRRMEVLVPAHCRKRFHHIVSTKLDARFNFSMVQAYGKQALNE